jgi:hypothetical protein
MTVFGLLSAGLLMVVLTLTSSQPEAQRVILEETDSGLNNIVTEERATWYRSRAQIEVGGGIRP